MNQEKIKQIFDETAYIRTGGSIEELRCAQYLQAQCAQLGLEAKLERFAVPMSEMKTASLVVDGEEIPCKGYFCAGSSAVEAPFYYLPNTDDWSMAQCKGKIVMIDGYLGYWKYQDLLKSGAVGFITYDGNANYVDENIDQRELRSYVHQGHKIPGVNIHAKAAIRLVENGAQQAKIVLDQNEYEGESHNVVLDLPGESSDTIVFTAHYDSTPLSQGAYDNMSGSIGLLAAAEYFSAHSHRASLRFVWCGSEERGLLGSKAYVAAHEAELDSIILNINLDMIGCIMGYFHSCATAEEKLVHYIEYFASEYGFGMQAVQGVYSSDSTPFADKGIPAVSFAREAPSNTATIHNSYDTAKVMSPRQMMADMDFIIAFADRMANAAKCPVERKMPDNMKEELDCYLMRKRKTAK